MKLKYYMRGVGTGILFSIFIFVVIIIPNREYDNNMEARKEEIKNNKQTDLSGILGSSEEEKPNGVEESTPAAPTASPTIAPTAKPTAAPTASPTIAPTAKPTAAPEMTDTVSITVRNGMTSEEFSMKAEDEGLVESWEELNRYIVHNGYAEKLQIGSFTFTKGMSISDITKKVTGR